MRPLDDLPVVTVAGAVVQARFLAVLVADGRPLDGLGRGDDGDGLVDLGRARREGLDDGADLVGVDAPHAGVAQQCAGPLGGALQRVEVLELGHDAVRRRLGAGMAGGGYLELGADDQRMVELPFGRHRAVTYGAAVRRHEVQQTEGQRLDARVRGDGKHLAQRAVGLDQRMQGHRPAAGCVDGLRGALHVGQAVGLGQHQVGRAHCRTQHRAQHVPETRVLQRQQPHADAAVLVVAAAQQRGDEVRLLDLAAHRGAVLVVQRHIEDRTHLRLQLQALAHAHLDACVVVAHRQGRAEVVAVEQRLARAGRVCGRVHQSRCLTPSCSPVSSARVLLMQAWLKSSTGRLGTMLYLPASQVTG